jgi:hypothetical protein
VATVNVLADDDIRQGIKEFSNWPTIPQLYVGGEFVGGADIMREMYQAASCRSSSSKWGPVFNGWRSPALFIFSRTAKAQDAKATQRIWRLAAGPAQYVSCFLCGSSSRLCAFAVSPTLQ